MPYFEADRTAAAYSVVQREALALEPTAAAAPAVAGRTRHPSVGVVAARVAPVDVSEECTREKERWCSTVFVALGWRRHVSASAPHPLVLSSSTAESAPRLSRSWSINVVIDASSDRRDPSSAPTLFAASRSARLGLHAAAAAAVAAEGELMLPVGVLDVRRVDSNAVAVASPESCRELEADALTTRTRSGLRGRRWLARVLDSTCSAGGVTARGTKGAKCGACESGADSDVDVETGERVDVAAAARPHGSGSSSTPAASRPVRVQESGLRLLPAESSKAEAHSP